MNATGSFASISAASISAVEAGELLVDPELEARRELRLRGPARRHPPVGLVAVPEPGAGADADRGGPEDDGREGEQPGEQVETARPGRGQHLRPELGDEVVVDLLLRPAGGELDADEGLHLLCERRARLVEGLVAGRADEPRLDLRLRRVLAAVRAEGEREAEDERQDREDGGERLHRSGFTTRLRPALRLRAPCGSPDRAAPRSPGR